MNKEVRSKLKKRAVELAIETENRRDASAVLEIVEFTLAGENYGVETTFIKEVITLKDFTILPGVPSFVLGIFNLRGRILPLVDVKKFFNLPDRGIGELNKIIILYNEQMEFGILADEINGTKVVFMEDVMHVPSTITGIGEKYLKGITKERLIILSADILLAEKNIVVNEMVIQ